MQQIERIMLQRMGKDLKQFKRPFLNRRISARMRTVRVQDGSEYARILESDTNEPALLFKSFSINVTEFYRDAFVWESVARNILPKLLQDRTGPIHVWSAGSASGEEPYSLAILLKESLGARKIKFDVLATDISLEALNRARNGQYQTQSLKNLPPGIISKYFTQNGSTYQVSDALKQHVRFEQGDIASFVIERADLIFCRNVLIYYDKPAQEMIFKRFHRTLANDGYLVIGQDETMMGIQASKIFSCIHPRERIYTKIATQ
ncbi:CheR family methyltransferase [Candidatus Nitrosotenuis cloacae]|uniref:CheR family methyltransferase n=1 Tax=Candidatus Nitrosotenuis cloacae TaxID=1603555 RepID=UPI002280E364|nr:CheR family methyltransferase [Candidatus Nitrosotenuis cloacae]